MPGAGAGAEAVRARVGIDYLLRVRGQGHHPLWVRGLVIDDSVSVVRRGDYYDTHGDEYEQMSADAGAVYLHTCGPTAQSVDLFGRLPGLLASEFLYAERQQKTARQD